MRTLFLIFTMLISTCSFAYDVQLLSAEQLKQLPKEEQVKYLREVQKILMGMTQRTSYMAEWMQQASRFPASTDADEQQRKDFEDAGSFVVTNGKNAADTGSFVKKDVQVEAPKAVASAPAVAASAAASAPAPAASAPAVAASASTVPAASTPRRGPSIFVPTKNSDGTIEYIEKFDLTEEEKKALRKQFPNHPVKSKKPTVITEAADGKEIPEGSAAPAKSPASAAASPASAPASATSSNGSTTTKSRRVKNKDGWMTISGSGTAASTTTSAHIAQDKPAESAREGQPMSIRDAVKAVEAERKGEVATNTQPAAKVETPVEKKPAGTRKNFRCMYSGWVVEGPDCVGPQKIPDWLSFSGMKNENKSCPNGKVVCMPLIFGLVLPGPPSDCKTFKDCPDKAKPICVNKGAWPTVDCYKAAQLGNYKSTKVAAELIMEAPEQYKKYQDLFQDLCDEEQIKTNPFADNYKGKPRSKEQAARIRDDITKTCSWASKQIQSVNELTKMHLDRKKVPQQSPASATGGAQGARK